jgi:hypothetical protein
MSIRVTRAPYAGQSGVVEGLPEQAAAVEGGLRVPVASVRLTTGEVVTIPIANVEAFAG